MKKKTFKYISLFFTTACLLGLWYGAGWTLQNPTEHPTPNKESQRIISMAPSITEILFEIEASDQVVAVSSFTEWPEEAKSRPTLGGHLDPSLEAIIALNPDLVVTNGHLPGVGNSSQGFKIKEIPFETFDDIEHAITTLGALTGKNTQAATLNTRLNQEMDTIRRWVSTLNPGPKPKVLLVIGRDPGVLRHVYGASGASFLVYALNTAGAQDAIGSKTHWPTLSTEQIVQSNPDIILELAPGQDTTHEAVRAVWQEALPTLEAVRKNKIYVLTEKELLIPGPRLPRVAQRMAEVVHGEVFGGPL